MIEQYTEAGYRVFPLWPITPEGNCACGDPYCEQPGKHPRISNWTQVPQWSDEQIEVMVEHQDAGNHFGVVVDGFLVVDVDPRNGGNESYWKLVEDLGGEDLALSSGFVLHTGGDGRHIYFDLPKDDGGAYVQHLGDYPGIDFKTNGFVVGAGSLHASGNRYTAQDDPSDITQAPEELLEKIRRPEAHRSQYRGETMDMTHDDIRQMLSYINNSGDGLHYEDWVKIGMAIHHATGGSGYWLWDEWSRDSNKYDPRMMDKRWHSFGKCANPATLATIIYFARQGGYVPPVMFTEQDQPTENEPFDTSHIDLLRPPGLTGRVAQWINGQCRYPRERLAMVAALTSLGNIAGLRHTDDKDGATLNLLSLCVAGSATGKEAVLQSATAIHEAVSIQRAVVGSIKSEQEIIRNLTRNQAAYYLIDEVGYLLQKVESARKNGGAAYLDGIIAAIMAAYSKADGTFLITGDLKDTLRRELIQELKHCQSKISENEDPNGFYQRRATDIEERAIPEVDLGIAKPFLSMMGMTTPVSFEDMVNVEQATNGFIGRCLLIREPETNPRRKRRWRKPKRELPEDLRMSLCRLYDGGSFDAINASERVEQNGERVEIPTEDEALDMLEGAADWLEDHAEYHKGRTGLEAIVRRSYEHLTKVSTILALGEGVRTPEHVRWAFRLIREDLENKIALTQANVNEGTYDALRVRVLDAAGDGEKRGTIRKRVARAKHYQVEDADRMIDHLVGSCELVEEEHKHSKTKRVYYTYKRL